MVWSGGREIGGGDMRGRAATEPPRASPGRVPTLPPVLRVAQRREFGPATGKRSSQPKIKKDVSPVGILNWDTIGLAVRTLHRAPILCINDTRKSQGP